MSPSQSNTIAGELMFNAGEDLTSKEGRLLQVVKKDASTAEVKLPTAITQVTPFVLTDGDVEDEKVKVLPLSGERNVRIYAKGTGSAGHRVVMADPAVAADKGKVRSIEGLSANDYLVVGVAEETFVDGQLVAVRPLGPYVVTVS